MKSLFCKSSLCVWEIIPKLWTTGTLIIGILHSFINTKLQHWQLSSFCRHLFSSPTSMEFHSHLVYICLVCLLCFHGRMTAMSNKCTKNAYPTMQFGRGIERNHFRLIDQLTVHSRCFASYIASYLTTSFRVSSLRN